MSVERQVEADDEQPEVPLAQRLAQHSPGHLGEPVVERAEDREEDAAHDDVVEMRHHEIRVAELPIERRRRSA